MNVWHYTLIALIAYIALFVADALLKRHKQKKYANAMKRKKAEENDGRTSDFDVGADCISE